MTKTKKAKPAKKSAPAKKSKPAKKTSPAKKTASTKKVAVKTKPTSKVSVKTKKQTKSKSSTIKPKAKITTKKTVKAKTKKSAPVKSKKSNSKIVVKPKENQQSISSSISAKNFLFTGTLTTMQRKEAEQIVKDLGGKILSGVSDKLDYLVIGEKAGSKLKAAKKISNIKIIDEATFNSMISSNNDSIENDNVETNVTYKIKYHIYGYGSENCVDQLDEKQLKYWKKKYKEDAYDAEQELKDHVWDYDYSSEIPETHFGKWHDISGIVHEEKVSYSESSKLNIEVYKNDELIDTIEISVTDKKIEKKFRDEFVPNKKAHKGKAYIYCRSVDRGLYCYGETQLDDGVVFDLSKISLNVGKIFNDQFVMDIIYDGDYLEDEGCYDSTGKSFDAEIIFF